MFSCLKSSGRIKASMQWDPKLNEMSHYNLQHRVALTWLVKGSMGYIPLAHVQLYKALNVH